MKEFYYGLGWKVLAVAVVAIASYLFWQLIPSDPVILVLMGD